MTKNQKILGLFLILFILVGVLSIIIVVGDKAYSESLVETNNVTVMQQDNATESPQNNSEEEFGFTEICVLSIMTAFAVVLYIPTKKKSHLTSSVWSGVRSGDRSSMASSMTSSAKSNMTSSVKSSQESDQKKKDTSLFGIDWDGDGEVSMADDFETMELLEDDF